MLSFRKELNHPIPKRKNIKKSEKRQLQQRDSKKKEDKLQWYQKKFNRNPKYLNPPKYQDIMI